MATMVINEQRPYGVHEVFPDNVEEKGYRKDDERPLVLLRVVLLNEGAAIEAVFLNQPEGLLDVPDRLIRSFVEVHGVDAT
jgi:hypothetical protein